MLRSSCDWLSSWNLTWFLKDIRRCKLMMKSRVMYLTPLALMKPAQEDISLMIPTFAHLFPDISWWIFPQGCARWTHRRNFVVLSVLYHRQPGDVPARSREGCCVRTYQMLLVKGKPYTMFTTSEKIEFFFLLFFFLFSFFKCNFYQLHVHKKSQIIWGGKNLKSNNSTRKIGSLYPLPTYHFLLPRINHFSWTLAWSIPWKEEPGRLQSMGVAKSWTRLSGFTFTFHFPALEKEMATHSSVLAWRIPGMGEPGGLPSMGSHFWTWLKQLSSSSMFY